MKSRKRYVYFNLHKSCWSIMIRGKVVWHADSYVARDPEFRVRPGGHARVLREGRKNVHAFVVSDGPGIISRDPEGERVRVKYNPHKGAFFYREDTGERVTGARYAILNDRRELWAIEPY